MIAHCDLAYLDTETVVAQRLARAVAQHRAQQSRLSADPLERLVQRRHRIEFAALSWHGRSSHQRIVWQDADVQAALADSATVRAVAQRSTTMPGPVPTVASLLLDGLATTRPSYLLTAAPNWRCRPPLPWPSWSSLSDMAAPEDSRPPMLVTKPGVAAGLAAIHGYGMALATTLPELLDADVNDNADEAALWSALDRATIESLQRAIATLLDEPRARLLVRGVAGASTELDRMSGQCLEVMTELPALLEFHRGDYAAVLGNGLVSHALDAKHLIAAIVTALTLGRRVYRRVTTPAAAANLANLLAAAASGEVGVHAASLMRARLRQSVRLITDHRDRLNIESDLILGALIP